MAGRISRGERLVAGRITTTAVVVHVFCTALGKKPETLTHACTRVKSRRILSRMDLSVCSIISVRSNVDTALVIQLAAPHHAYVYKHYTCKSEGPEHRFSGQTSRLQL